MKEVFGSGKYKFKCRLIKKLKLNVLVCGLTLNIDIFCLKYIMISLYFIYIGMSSTIFENCLNPKFNS